MGQPDPERICTSIIERQSLSVSYRHALLHPPDPSDWRVIGNGYMLLAVGQSREFQF